MAWDAPGAGGSSDPPEQFGMAGYADCLAGFIDALGMEKPHVAGLSFGGALALAFQGRHPAVAGTLILVSAHAGWSGSLARRRRRATPSAGVQAGGPAARGVRGDAASHDVLGGNCAGVDRCVRREHAGVPPGRLPGHGARVRRKPPPRAAHGPGADALGAWRHGRSSTAERRRGPPRLESPARGLSCCRAPVMSAASRPRRRSTRQLRDFLPRRADPRLSPAALVSR